MFGLFTPRYVNEGRELLKAAGRILSYKRDSLKPEELEALTTQMGRLEEAIRNRDPKATEEASHELDDLFSKHVPRHKDAGIRENCEVFLVAVVIAIGVRTFFLQPFTIPTGSMHPTLNGIDAFNTTVPAPNFLVQALHFAIYGRSYVDIVSKQDDVIVGLSETKLRFLSITNVQCEKQHFYVFCDPETLARNFPLTVGRPMARGEVVARGYINTGDHVFVDKVSYNFRNPHRGEVFVFNTAGIPTRENLLTPGAPSQFYIKRLVGLPGDILRVECPKLYINGELAKAAPFQRVMSLEDGYNGYSNPTGGQGPFGAHYLTNPDDTFHVPERSYFAMGDNSFNSSDSRYWGIVPDHNVMGRGLFVYWPFNSHWGFIR